MLVLFGFLLRIKSFNELNFMITNNEFSKLYPRETKLPKVDAISKLKGIFSKRCKT